MSERTLRGKVAVAGVGETVYHKHGQSPDPEFKLALDATLAAAKDAGIDPREIDGFASFSNDRNEATRIAAALGLPELRFSNMMWGGGGGGGAGAVGNAAAAIATGLAECVVVFRALAQGQFGRFGSGGQMKKIEGPFSLESPHGLMTAAQRYAMKAQRIMHEHGISRTTQRAVSMAAYHHAQNNPNAVMNGKPLSEEKYDNSRWITEPFCLYDCCQENDGAAAIILVSADRAKDLPHKPVYLLAAAQGSGFRDGATCHNPPDYATSSFKTLVPRLYESAGVGASDVDVMQSYENFTGGVVMSLIEHGFCEYEEANEFITYENLIAPSGKLPLNTSGGNLAECYMHGFEMQLEAVRQLRGTSTNQVPDAKVAMVNAGPMVPVVSNVIYGTQETL